MNNFLELTAIVLPPVAVLAVILFVGSSHIHRQMERIAGDRLAPGNDPPAHNPQ